MITDCRVAACHNLHKESIVDAPTKPYMSELSSSLGLQYDSHLRDLISAAGGQVEETALPSEKKHRVSFLLPSWPRINAVLAIQLLPTRLYEGQSCRNSSSSNAQRFS
jgi:hypothetical protein